MLAPTPLDAAQLERLAELLDERAVPFKGFNLEALDGFLSALIVGPDMVMPSEWQPSVWGGKPPRWIDEAEAREVQTLLMGFWNLIARRVRCEPDEMPDALAPVIWIPDDLDPERHADLDIGHDWGMGFLRGIELRKDAWRGWFDAEDWIVECLEWITQLVSGEVLGDEPDAPTTPLTVTQRLETITEIPAMLNDLHHYRIEQATPRTPIRRAPTPGRNDPCPCGSGKKYKKCCG